METRTRIIIHVRGGIVQDVTTDQDTEIYLHDADLVLIGESFVPKPFPADVVAPSAFNTILKNLTRQSTL